MTVFKTHGRTAAITFLIVTMIAMSSATAFAQNSAWEGASAVGSATEFPPAGLYAASDTFPRNSMVDVLNLDTGRRARLIVVRRLDIPGLFMTVSPEAAKDLGMDQNGTARLRVTPITMPGLTNANPANDLPYSTDPDVNPAASVTDPNAAVKADRVAGTPLASPGGAPQTALTATSPVPSAQAAPAASVAAAPIAAPPLSAAQPAAPNVPAVATPEVPAGPQMPLTATQPMPVPSTSQPSPGTPISGPASEQIAQLPLPKIEQAGEQLPGAQPSTNALPLVSAQPSAVAQPLASAQSSTGLQPPAGSQPPANRKPLEIVQSPAPSGSAPAESIFSRPAKTDEAAAEIATLAGRTPQQSLFVAPRPPDVASMLPPANAPPNALAVSPNELAVAVPVQKGAPPSSGLPAIAPPAPGVTTGISEVPELPGRAPQAIAETRPPAAQIAPSGLDLADLSLPEPQSGIPDVSLPIASAPSLETPAASAPSLAARPATVNVGSLPLAQVPEAAVPEIGDLGPVAPPKPESPVTPAPDAIASAPLPERPAASLPPIAATPSEAPATSAAVTPKPVEQPAAATPAATVQPAATEKSAPVPAKAEPPAIAASTTLPAAGEAWAQKNLPLVTVLKSNSFYLQIGAYFSPESARSALERVAAGYPLVVLPATDHGRVLYRVFVGPLSGDEEGAVLYWFRTQGYNDAFVRRGGES